MFNNADISFFFRNFTRHFMHQAEMACFIYPPRNLYPPQPSQREGVGKEREEKRGRGKEDTLEKEGKKKALCDLKE